MMPDLSPSCTAELALPDPDATDALGAALADRLQPGDTVLLTGPIGAGKSQLARAAIRRLLARAGAPQEDIPSPTYTLVQTYQAGDAEIWHADLYRLTDPSEVWELGLETAFEDAICLVEWPDRLGSAMPAGALHVTLSASADDGRLARIEATGARWKPVIGLLARGEAT